MTITFRNAKPIDVNLYSSCRQHLTISIYGRTAGIQGAFAADLSSLDVVKHAKAMRSSHGDPVDRNGTDMVTDRSLNYRTFILRGNIR